MFGIQIQLERWKRRVFLWLAIGSLLLAFPPFNFFPFAWLTPAFLLACLYFTPLNKAFRYGYFFAFLFSLISLYWIGYVTAAGWVFAAFFQGIYGGFFGWGSRYLMEPVLGSSKIRYRLIFCIGVASLWALLEVLRVNLPGFGFGWNLLSYSQASFMTFIQLAEWTGAYGLSFIMVLLSSLLFVVILDFLRPAQHRFLRSLFYFSLILALLGVGYATCWKLSHYKRPSAEIRLGVIQGNISQSLKWQPEAKEKIIEKYVKLSQLAAYDQPDLLIWPEAAYPGFLLGELERSEIPKLIQDAKIPFVIGSPRYEDGKLYNSAFLFNQAGKLETVYDKKNLVPFGEYIPFKQVLFFLEKLAYSFGVGDFEGGTQWTVFQGPAEVGFASLVCFENIFPELTREFTERGSQFFIVITNDAWFKRSRAPYEHLYTSQFRAIETRRPFVHAANTGLSAFINARGEIVDILKDKRGNELFITGGMTRSIYPETIQTFYVTYGQMIPWFLLCVSLFSLGIVYISMRGKK